MGSHQCFYIEKMVHMVMVDMDLLALKVPLVLLLMKKEVSIAIYDILSSNKFGCYYLVMESSWKMDRLYN